MHDGVPEFCDISVRSLTVPHLAPVVSYFLVLLKKAAEVRALHYLHIISVGWDALYFTSRCSKYVWWSQERPCRSVTDAKPHYGVRSHGLYGAN